MNVEVNNSFSRKEEIEEIITQLKEKLISFKVVDRDGRVLGSVKDIYVTENNEVELLISLIDSLDKFELFLLDSNYIEQIDLQNKSLTVNLSQTEIKNLPLYQPCQGEIREVTETSMANNQQDKKQGIREEISVPLLEERLLVNRNKRKVGEVIVRKKVETRLVQVPVRWEKLIVEQVGAETKQLAEIDLGHGEVTGADLKQRLADDSGHTVSGEFVSLKAASDLLEAIALKAQHGCSKVRIEITVSDREKQAIYREMFERCSAKKLNNGR
jgi:stress response protein YsnF